MKNQCDGCRAGIPVVNGTHRMGREGGYPDLMGCTAKQYAEVMDATIVAPREMLRRAADILGSQGLSAWDGLAADIRTLLAAPEQTTGYTAVDMANAAADGFRDGAASAGKDAARYQHLKATWEDGGLLERLESNVLPKDWDAEIDRAMSKEG